MGRLFGTDGIRGVANEEPLTTELAFRLGRQLVATLLEHHGLAKVAPGRRARHAGCPAPCSRARSSRVRCPPGAMSSRSACCRRPASPISRDASRPRAAWCSRPPTTPSRTMASRSSLPRAPSFPTAGRTRSRRAWAARTGAQAHGRLGRTSGPLRPGRGRVHRAVRARLSLRPGRSHGGSRLRPRRHLVASRPGSSAPSALGSSCSAARPDGLNINRQLGRAPSRAAPAPSAGRGRGSGLAFDGDGDG